MAKAAMTPQEQLEDLQKRFQLLEGERKATYETAKLNIQQNKEIIKQMKEENKVLRNQISDLRNEKPQSLEKQLNEAMTEVSALSRRFDALKHDSLVKTQHLNELSSKHQELALDAKLPKTEDSPQMRHIRVLENRLDKAMIKYNEAQSIKKTYEGIVKRLSQERIGFDNQLAGIERTLKSKERDYEELLLLSHDAYHAKEMAQAELHRFEQGVMEERNQRDREVQEKKILVQQRVDMNQRLEQREKMLKKQQEQDRAAERQRQELDATAGTNAGAADDDASEEQQKLQDYEAAFIRIKEATGVNDVNEVIQKFLTQEDTRTNLIRLTKENQASIDRLTEDRRRLKLQVEDLKFAAGGSVGRAKQVDEFEKALSEANEKFERNRSKFERIAKMLISMKSGIAHLSEKLVTVKLGDEGPIEITDDSVEDVLQQCALKMTKLMNKTSHLDDPALLDNEEYDEKLLSRTEVRVKLADQEKDDEDEDDDFEDDMDEDVHNRKHVKYNSEQVLEKQMAKNRRKGKKKGGA
eukprot:TRINITY_DN25742_c0_g1_i1.p1 TRINITY_DN25742_c0_g1~~TRINITY_DN25742_c0_g1_i1.p1  ORF type:complete len:525 (-),score=196.63 TRINITY_DN25742_c0_g1_i1:788-2362(-)